MEHNLLGAVKICQVYTTKINMESLGIKERGIEELPMKLKGDFNVGVENHMALKEVCINTKS